jgi:quercetin dioxygenase-like cupin family protein
MQRLVRTCAGLSTAFILAALSAPAIGAQAASAKQAEPAKQADAKKQTAPAAAAKHVMVAADEVKWGPAPPSLPPGAQAAVLDGDPTKAGLFAVRLKFPNGYTVPPHWHPTDEHLVILSGTLLMGTGPKLDESSMHALAPGAYSKIPRRMNHYVRAKGEVIAQLSGIGPFTVTYVNASDDPRKKTSD